MNRPGAVGFSLEQFAKRQAQHPALRQDNAKPRCLKFVRRKEFFVTGQRPKFRFFGGS
jgi:hypothetical protein